MGYGIYLRGDGVWGGYAVNAQCDWPGCYTKIDRGSAYHCGALLRDGFEGCEGFFCESHKTALDLCLMCAGRDDSPVVYDHPRPAPWADLAIRHEGREVVVRISIFDGESVEDQDRRADVLLAAGCYEELELARQA